MSSDGINSLKVSVFILSFFYFFISTICLVRLFLLCKRSKDFGYKKTFFLITSFFSIGRIIYLLLQVFKEQTINKTWFKIFGSLLSDIFILTFLLLTFALANSFYESKSMSRYDSNQITKKIRYLFLFFLLLLVALSILFSVLDFWKYLMVVYESTTYFFCAVVLLVYSWKLLKTFPRHSDNYYYFSIKRVFSVIIICTIIHFIRIPLLVYYYVAGEQHSNTLFIAIYFFFYFFLSEIVTTFLIVFVILRVPFKKSEFRILDDSSKTNYITSQEDTDDEDTEAFNTYF
ncbi:tobamovirus multiplication protein 1-like isoform x1 [Anaeramoeba flamelloides]|uniref:Tobamovirus multiplication protein 1-like isoform x1 n=1 Tax=Anaeramoeba flamelloides TaxID=1746091 RepID=A0AAV7YFB5_9EUKA|nr:tobamovirus multiplication protein 1-like isoform x1 [Anaeramoeba flamelloides]